MLATATVAAHSVTENLPSIARLIHQLAQNVQLVSPLYQGSNRFGTHLRAKPVSFSPARLLHSKTVKAPVARPVRMMSFT